MPTDCISYQESGYFSKIIVDYLDQKPALQSFYNHFPTIENFQKQLLEKQNSFPEENRKVLVSVLKKQYTTIPTSISTKHNIEALADSNTFTITTGHQLNLFTGPLYFLYKIVSTINLTKELKAKYPSYNFVPIYWMATEDHDFEEINYFNFKGKKIRWNTPSTGPVGRLSTEGLNKIYAVFAAELGSGSNADSVKKLFQEAYLDHTNLADATRYLANSLFGEMGLVILDADNSELKKIFSPFIKDELLNQTSNKFVLETIEKLKEYPIQVNPREINLFYLKNDLRARIIFEDSIYKVHNTKIEFSESEILSELKQHPEKFSPNVIMRPLYQEVILPNLCYIGGGGELAYWFELKSYFDAVQIPLPILLLRNSVLLATEKQLKKAEKLQLSWLKLFSKQSDLITIKVKELSTVPIDFSTQKQFLNQQFESLYAIASQTDYSFTGAVKAQEAKQIKGLENLEKRLLKAQKKKYSDVLNRITGLQNELFPNHSLQERTVNYSEFYLENGTALIDKLLSELKPLENNFTVLIV